jgi:hypothetical protein
MHKKSLEGSHCMPKAHIRTFHQTEMIYRQVLQPELCSTPQLLASPEETNEE